MTVAGFIAAQRTEHGVPHTVACRALDVSESWFYKWKDRPPTAREQRRERLRAEIQGIFCGSERTYGSPRVHRELRDRGWVVTRRRVAELMAADGLAGRPKKRRRGLTRQDRKKVPFKDLVRRDFTAPAPDVKWCGDLTEIPTLEGTLYLASVEDLFSRRLLGFAMSEHPDAVLARDAIQMAVAVRGGSVTGVIFHTDRGSTYTADLFTEACRHHRITQSMGRTGSCLDNAAAESFFSTLEHELLSRNTFATKEEARRRVANWIDSFYNRTRRHSTCQMLSPVNYELFFEQERLGEAEAA
ncbi:MAG: IS3 family transposase [Acidimicrobiia bacterium]